MRSESVGIFALLTLLPSALYAQTAAPKDDADLAVINAGVAAAEDAPFASPGYEFYPGESLYASFEISGFHVSRNEEANSQRIALAYEVRLQDLQERPLTAPQHDSVEVQLNPEDKNWIPKRRAEFVLPAQLPAGTYQLRVSIEDTIGHGHAAALVSFHVGGERISLSEGLSIQHFHFLRTEDSSRPLDLPAYRPGDTIFVSFDVAGFAVGVGNRYRLSYSVLVTGPDGKPFLKETDPVRIEAMSFYPAQYVVSSLQVSTANASARGSYRLTLRVEDQVGNRTRQFPFIFTIE